MWISVGKVFLNLWCVFVFLSYLPTNAGLRRRHKSNRGQHSLTENENDLYNEQSVRRSRSNIYDFSEDDNDIDETGDNYVPDELYNYSATDKEVEKVRRKRIDPKGSWLTFVNRMEDKNPEKKKKRKKRKRNKKSNENILLGPPGPAGPPGPPGPPGPSFTKEDIIKELEDLIKAEAEKRAHEMLADMIHTNHSHIHLAQDSTQYLNIPRVYSGFSMRLGSKARVRRKTLMEIKSFQQPFGGGSFQRAETFNAQNGRFYAPRTGVYQFTANLHIRLRTKRKLKGKPKLDEHLKVVICIDSLCQTNTSIETITSIHIDNIIITATVSGFLQLQEKQYTSLYVDNSSSYNIVVMKDSEYSGIFLGV